MTVHLARIASRLFNSPLLVMPGTAITLASNLASRFGVAPMRAPDPNALTSGKRDGASDRKPYEVVDGTAIVTVLGELVNRGSWMDAASGLTAYETLSANLRAAEADPKVRNIVLDIDSPGGEAAGAMECAAVVRAVSKVKTVVAFVNSCACSAAYAIAAGATEIVATPSAMIGSIGVVWLHMDHSEMLREAGLKPTLLHSGAYKIDGNQFAPLEPEAAARIGTTIDAYYDLLVAGVGEHRPQLGKEGARGTEAGVFVGQSAVDAGLADSVGTMSGILENFKTGRTGRFPAEGGSMHTSLSKFPIAEEAPSKPRQRQAAISEAERGARAAAAALGKEFKPSEFAEPFVPTAAAKSNAAAQQAEIARGAAAFAEVFGKSAQAPAPAPSTPKSQPHSINEAEIARGRAAMERVLGRRTA